MGGEKNCDFFLKILTKSQNSEKNLNSERKKNLNFEIKIRIIIFSVALILFHRKLIFFLDILLLSKLGSVKSISFDIYWEMSVFKSLFFDSTCVQKDLNMNLCQLFTTSCNFLVIYLFLLYFVEYMLIKIITPVNAVRLHGSETCINVQKQISSSPSFIEFFSPLLAADWLSHNALTLRAISTSAHLKSN